MGLSRTISYAIGRSPLAILLLAAPAMAQTFGTDQRYCDHSALSQILSTSKGNLIGSAAGGAAGGLLGSQFGKSSGKGVATALGVVGGALLGNSIEAHNNAPRMYQSYRVSIQTDNGGYRAFDVPSPGDLRIGDRVVINNGQISRY